ncbi:MAG: hypothetical protein Q8N53_05950 [Longimicrobiales bacterium]|nr:hypothetical protein [Longimicrobiales bacterium]
MSARHRRLQGAALAAVALLLGPWAARPAGAQVTWRDLVVTMGGSVEAYSGNLSAVTGPVVDSTDQVLAVVGEMGVRGDLSLGPAFVLSFDGGMRQTAALGFQLRDYAPREWVGSASGRYSQSLGGWGSLVLGGGVRGRSVRDRPPMPLFLQPGYTTLQGSAGVLTRSFDGVTFDGQVDLERADYRAQEFLPQINLLDRTSSGLEAGVRWGGTSVIRFYGGFRWTDYGNQGSFDPEDPFRRDRTARVGLEWTYAGALFAQVGVDGTVNRSNGNRPEYDAVSARALLTAALPLDFSLNIFALLTMKSYVHEIDFVFLVPGEEADNASIAYLQLGRPIATDLDGAFRLGWTRAETDIGNTYYRRLGASLQLNYRPNGF